MIFGDMRMPDPMFAESNGKDLGEKFPMILVYPPGSKEPIKYDGDIKNRYDCLSSNNLAKCGAKMAEDICC